MTTTEPLDLDAIFQADEERVRGADTITIDPFAKFNPYHDELGRFSSRPGGPGSVSTPSPSSSATPTVAESKQRLQSTFPNALVNIADRRNGLPPDPVLVQGITDGLTRLAAEFPDVAKQVALIRMSDDATQGMGETIITTVRKPDGSTASGFGLMFNTYNLSKAEYDHSVRAVNEGGWGYQDAEGNYSMRSNTFSLRDFRSWSESTAVHEFGHAVHMLSTSRQSGESILDAFGTGKNPALWNEVVAPHTITPKASTTHRLVDYIVNVTDSSTPPPSLYGGGGAAEVVAEAFAYRHGPPGSGLLGRSRLDPALEAIIVDIEEGAK